MSAPSGPLAPQYVHGVYIPSALLIVGVAIIKQEWLPYAVALAAVLGGVKVWRNSKTLSFTNCSISGLTMRQ
jgi:cytochrome-b5 reductase